MGIFTWIVLGLIVGVLAKWIMPGEGPSGFFLTVFLGIAGAIVGGYLGSFLGLGTMSEFSLTNILVATGGAVLLLFLYSQLKSGGN